MPTHDGTRNAGRTPAERAATAIVGRSFFLGIGIDAYAHFGKLNCRQRRFLVFVRLSVMCLLVLLVRNVEEHGLESHKPAELIEPKTDIFADNMVRVSNGTFIMGFLDSRDTGCVHWQNSAHEVALGTYYISKYEVTQAQWRSVMGSDPPELYNKGCDQCPVEGVNWDDIQDFLQKLNAQTGQGYRLPTEAEWEYAARGGQLGKANNYPFSGGNKIDEVAWYYGNYKWGSTYGSQKTTRPVGGKKSNELGLYDMSGNVCEVCSDWYGDYSGDAETNPKGAKQGIGRVIRGGSWLGLPQFCCTADRGVWYVSLNDLIGFRLARS